MKLSFSKYSGLGNDFIFVDNRQDIFEPNKETIRKLCNRFCGVGADGLVTIQRAASADVKMRIFNSDGCEAEMCGNALRCLYLFLIEIGFQKESFFVETYDRMLRVSKDEEGVCCEMGTVESIEWNRKVSLSNLDVTGHFLNTGVPHFVVFSSNLESLNVLDLGREICHHKAFSPNNTNVTFAAFSRDQNKIYVRTYERGVELETQACGTGAAAAAICGAHLFSIKTPVLVEMSLGQLKFDFTLDGSQAGNLIMKGSAEHIFNGVAPLEKVLL